MNKIIDIAIKDLGQQIGNRFAIGMMFVVPLMLAGLIYLAFGGLASSSGAESYSLPVIEVLIANLDKGQPGSEVNAGETLVAMFRSEQVANIFRVSSSSDFASARAAVDRKEAAVAVLVPENFTKSLLTDGGVVEVELYQDPTLTFGPALVKEMVSQLVDGFTGARINSAVMADQFKQGEQVLTPEMAAQAQAAYGDYYQTAQAENGWPKGVIVRAPSAQPQRTPIASIMGPMMAGMLIFAVFFTGSNGVMGILKEQEDGTLARLFTTPTPVQVILGGKLAAIGVMLVVQSIVLLVVSALLFQIQWGEIGPLALVIFGMVVASAGFGILLISFAKNIRQAGSFIGVGLSFTCMLGGLFTTVFQNVPAAFEYAGMIVPQGWALRGIKLVINGAGVGEVLLPVAVLLVMGAILFAIGARTFRTRFA